MARFVPSGRRLAPRAPPLSVDGVNAGRRHVDVLLVASSGGHLLQLLSLEAAWEGLDRYWVVEDTIDARSLLAGEHVFAIGFATERSIVGLLRGLPLAARLLVRLRPSVVVTTGAAPAVPYAWLGRLLGARVVYIESITRIEELSLAAKLIAPFATRMYVQWPELAEKHRRALYAGAVLGTR